MSLEAQLKRNNELLELQCALMEKLILELREKAGDPVTTCVLTEEQKQDRADAVIKEENAKLAEEQKQDRADAVIKEENAKLAETYPQQEEVVVPVAPAVEAAPVAPAVAPAVEAAPVTLDDVRHAIVRLSDTHGKPAVIRLLGRFGANKASELKADDYRSVIADCDKIIAGGEAA